MYWKVYFRVHYLHFAMIITPIVAGIVAVISLLTPPIKHKHVSLVIVLINYL